VTKEKDHKPVDAGILSPKDKESYCSLACEGPVYGTNGQCLIESRTAGTDAHPLSRKVQEDHTIGRNALRKDIGPSNDIISGMKSMKKNMHFSGAKNFPAEASPARLGYFFVHRGTMGRRRIRQQSSV